MHSIDYDLQVSDEPMNLRVLMGMDANKPKPTRTTCPLETSKFRSEVPSITMITTVSYVNNMMSLGKKG